MLATSECNHQTPQFRVLCEDQVEQVYQATLECLERTGVNVYSAEAHSLLAQAGASADGMRVRIPPRVIEDAVAAAPESFTLWGRPVGASRSQDESYKIEVCSPVLDKPIVECVRFGPGPTCTYFVDPQTGERRKSARGDPGLTAQVCDALDNLDYVMGLALIDDVTPELAPVYEFAEMVVNTAKPVLPWAYSVENVSDIHRIALAIAGSERDLRERPFLALFATFQSPLQHTREDLNNVLWAAERGLPVVYLGGGTSGSTAPITGAGTLVITLAGMLSGLAMLQLKRRGTPVCVGSAPQPIDLRSARPSYGAPEMSLYCAALSDICRYLGLPFMGTAGASESKTVDLQAAIESAVQVLLSGLSGTTLIHDVGFLDCADIGSLEMLVMNDEIIALTRRILRGIEISEDTLMLDLIDRVAPGGHFLAERETAQRCREEIWTSSLMDRDPWEMWTAAGAPTMVDRIRQRVQTILAAHRPPPLPTGAAEEIQAILEAAEARYL
ncbi:MAG: trimethylamine methyltransferase family protein [Anaerolineae bacterium]|jgi:trimethylamine--corrinoid protein Co-methyltransferase